MPSAISAARMQRGGAASAVGDRVAMKRKTLRRFGVCQAASGGPIEDDAGAVGERVE
jgi:hypothetical protein